MFLLDCLTTDLELLGLDFNSLHGPLKVTELIESSVLNINAVFVLIYINLNLHLEPEPKLLSVCLCDKSHLEYNSFKILS